MNQRTLHWAFAILSFALAFVVYTMTVQPSVPFWDCGEFSAASVWQQVPHPPGAPLFLIFGKLFHLLIPFGDDGWKINMVSVLSSALTVWLLYLITVMVIKNFRKGEVEDIGSAIAVYGSSFIAAAAFTFSDTFWFNAVESEVYANSSLFVAVVVYLMMRWNVEADKPDHEKYLLLIAYLIGLSTGVHLLSILAIFSIVLLVYFRKYEFKISTLLLTMVIGLVIFGIIYPGVVQVLPSLLAGHSPSRNEAMEYSIENSSALKAFAVLAIAGVGVLFWYGYKKQNAIIKLSTLSLLLVLLGYTTYTQILLRSNANPPMNENEPKTFSKLSSYIGREQYGNAPNWPRRYQTEDYFVQNYEKKDNSGNYIYGPWYPPGRKNVERKDGGYITTSAWNKVNASGELAYLWKYQIQHMYFRYFYWNFVGRMSDAQDAGSAWFSYDKKEAEILNYDSGYKHLFPSRFFALPLLFGLIGIFFHFKKDSKMAWVYLLMFLMMGVLAAIQQNQQDPQPRERDYFYAGSFMVYCMWIGIGAFGLIEWLARQKMKSAVSASIVTVSFVLVPLNMALGGWHYHSRAGNYLPFDYSYNILQSTEKNAILFTNGDNDTFPLWYLQDVAGVRRDVRIVNLSLGNTLWYVDQLKNREPWGAEKLPLSFSDDSLQNIEETDEGALSYDFGDPINIEIPVRAEILKQYTDDPDIIARGKMSFSFTGKPFGDQQDRMTQIFRVRDKLILDIVRETKFERPVYFSNTVGYDVYIGLGGFLRMEGMAYRVCPAPQPGRFGESVEMNITEKCLMNIDNSNNYSKEPQYGFKFRNLNNPSVYYDEVHRRLMISYRQLYLTMAEKYISMDQKEKAIKMLDKMNEMISYTQFPMPFEFEARIASIYDRADDATKAKDFAQVALTTCLELIDKDYLKPEYVQYELYGRTSGPFRLASQMYEILGDTDGAKAILTRFHEMVVTIRSQMAGQGYSEQDMARMDYTLADVQVSIDMLSINALEKQNKIQEAYKEIMKLYQSYVDSNSPIMHNAARILDRKISEYEEKLGIHSGNELQAAR